MEVVPMGSAIKAENNPSDNVMHDELADVFGGIVKAAKTNVGKTPDVNDITLQVLENDLEALAANGCDEVRINELRNTLIR